MNASLTNPIVKRGFQEGRKAFEIYVDDSSEPAGFAQFLDVEGKEFPQRIFPHTVVKKEFSGRGLASILIQHALDVSIEEGFRIVALCSYVEAWIMKHPDYQKYADAPEAQHFQALGE